MIRALIIWFALATGAMAQDFSGLARVDMAQSGIVDADSGVQIDLSLSQIVPYRVFTLDDPRRLVLDFREVDWDGVSRAALMNADNVTDVRFGPLRPGWSRMVVDLAAPLIVQEAGMTTYTDDPRAALKIVLSPASAEVFAERAGAPDDPNWDIMATANTTLPAPVAEDGPVTVMIDPGHGGIDPGAVQGGLIEADVVLQLAFEVADALNRVDGIRALLTRETDEFVPLEARMTMARAARVDLFISLHADALEEDEAQGASVYTLSADGEDRAAQRMAERHERGDLLAGLDFSGQDDRVAMALMDLARAETRPSGARFADALVIALRENGARLNSRPRREGRLAVLNAADFASVLFEAGFLSNAQDRDSLTDADGRARIVKSVVQAVQRWAQDEAVRAPLVRQ